MRRILGALLAFSFFAFLGIVFQNFRTPGSIEESIVYPVRLSQSKFSKAQQVAVQQPCSGDRVKVVIVKFSDATGILSGQMGQMRVENLRLPSAQGACDGRNLDVDELMICDRGLDYLDFNLTDSSGKKFIHSGPVVGGCLAAPLVLEVVGQ